MAKKARYAWGDETLVRIYIDSLTVIEEGDFVCLASAADVADDANITVNYGINPVGMVDAGAAAANRAAVAAQLLGIAKQSSPSGTEGYIIVGFGAVYVLDQQTAAICVLSTKIEVYADETSGLDQAVVAGATSSIGRCARTKAATGTEIFVLLKPALWEA